MTRNDLHKRIRNRNERLVKILIRLNHPRRTQQTPMRSPLTPLLDGITVQLFHPPSSLKIDHNKNTHLVAI